MENEKFKRYLPLNCPPLSGIYSVQGFFKMGLSEDGDDNLEKKRYEELCMDLNMDRNASNEAWQAYERINTNYTLEGDNLHWLACALYVACRKSVVPTVGRGVVEGNCVSLTRLLRSANLSLIQFFNKMKKWADMANLPQEFRDKVDRLQRNFAVSTVIFKKFQPIFLDIFKDPAEDQPRQPRSRKQRKPPCSSSDVFSMCWTFFVQVKSNFRAISDDLVNSYHLLLCCIDLFYSNVLLGNRRELLNLSFSGLPENINNKDYKPPEPPCIIQLLCEKHEGLIVEAKGIKEHWWKPHIKKLFDKKILKGKPETFSGILDQGNFEANKKAINKTYEEYVLSVGDFDERIFLGDDPSAEIGTPAKTTAQAAGELTEKMLVKQNLQQHFEKTNSLAPSTPLTGRKYLKEKEPNITPVSTATQSVSRLQALLCGRKTSPNDVLLEIFNDCSRNPREIITSRVKDMGEVFCHSYAQPSEEHSGSHVDFAKKRLQLGESLYYKTLENIMLNEKKRLPTKFDFSALLEQDLFHRSLFAACLEIVIFSYNSQRTFPWIIEVFDLAPYYFYKVVEVIIREEDGLSRDVVKHLNHIEEQILESLAWKVESPLWDAIKASGLCVPTCEEVSLNTSQIEVLPAPPAQVFTSPKTNPYVQRIVNIDKTPRRDLNQSPNTCAAERFNSPAPGSTSAKRRLFISQPNSISQERQGTSRANETILTLTNENSTLTPSLKTSITLQGEDGIMYVPLSSGFTVLSTNNSKHSTESKVSTPSKNSRPKRTGSLALFFRKVYYLANVRMRDLCERLDVGEDLRKKMWTCFEYSLIHHTDMMMDRHLDQIIMCAIYVIAKVCKEDKQFQEIMRCYRVQPQAESHVYRSVLLRSKKRRNSGSSDSSKNGASGSNSPVHMDEEKEKEAKRTERLSSIRSSSTLPVPHPNSQPPTPTKLAGTGTSFEFEDRGDLIKFYNAVYVKKVQNFVLKFSPAHAAKGESPPLSPLPVVKSNALSPRRRVSSTHCVYISPLKNNLVPQSPHKPLSYSFSKSPAKDLRAINNMIKLEERKVGKRLLQDDSDSDTTNKRHCSEEHLTRKLQSYSTDCNAVRELS